MVQKCGTSRIVRIALLAFEVLLIVKMILSFMQPRFAYSLFVGDMHSNGAIEVELDGKGWYIDNSIELDETTFLQTVPVNLPKGVYKIVIHHQTEGDSTTVNFSSDNITYRLIAGRQNLKLNSGFGTTEYEINLSESQENFKINFDFTSDGYAWISSVDIMQLWNMERVNAFYTIIFIGLIEFLWTVFRKGKIEKILVEETSTKSIMVVLLVSIPVVLSTLPCFSYYVIEGFDLNFHLMRIEGIAESIKSGCFPARIQTNWLRGYGYPVSVFYGDMLLYFPAALRMLGMSLQDAYKWYLFGINILTAITIYFAARGITKSMKMGVVAAYLYLLLPYRLSCIYTRSGVGEYSAMAFFPLIVWGLYRIYMIEPKSKEWKHLWIIPTIGFTGVIESHLLSTVFVGMFTILCCLILFKKTFQKDRFVELLKVVLATVAANVMYLVPVLDFMQNKYKVAENAQRANIQTQGAFVSQIFSLMPIGDGISLSITENLLNTNEITVSLGAVAWIGLVLLFIYIVLSIRRAVLDLKKCSVSNTVYLLLSMAIITVYMSSTIFPWDLFVGKIGELKSIFTSIEFPWRYLSLASVFFVLGIVAIINSELIKKDLINVLNLEETYINIVCIIMICFVMLSSGYFISNEITDGKYSYLVAGCDLDDSKLMGSEYIPIGVDESILLGLNNPEARGVVINEFNSGAQECVLSVVQTTMGGNISVPRIYYDGYAVKFDGKNGWFDCYSDDLGRVCFDIPEGYEGQAIVRFREPWYWRISEVVSIITIVEMLYILGVKKYGNQEK